MQNVSNDWKSVQNQQLVNESYIEISFSIADPDAIADASAKDNGAVYISDTAQIVSEVEKSVIPYATLEENLWLLDGNRRVVPESNYTDNGYVGNILSNADCGFDKIPCIDIEFSKTHDPVIPGITIVWGSAYGDCAKTFQITAFSGNSIIAEKTVSDNSSVTSIVEFDIESYDKIRIEILRWCLPFHRPRIAKVLIGINKTYGKRDVISYDHTSEVDPIAATTPVGKIEFSIDNSNNQYDPNNPTGLSKYLMEQQEIKVRYGLKLNNNIVEYIPAGTFYLSEWDAPQNGIEASFTARDLLGFLQQTYTKGMYKPTGENLYNLAIGVLAEANLPLNDDGSKKWVVSDTLKSVTTIAPLPLKSLAECLQYIAQAGCCVIYCDRSGTLHIEPISTANTDYALSNFNLFSRPEISLQKPLMSVSTKVYNYFADETGKELFSGNVTVNGTKEVIITYSQSAVNATATVTGGTLVSATYYTNTCHLKIAATGEVTIKVTGDFLKKSDSNYVTDVEDSGTTQTVDNPLITSTAVATTVSAWVKDWLRHRKIIKMDGWRADPRLDATDIISSANKFSTESVRMTSVQYSFTGAFSGTGEGRVI